MLGPRVDHVCLLADVAAHPRRLLPGHLHLPPRRRDLSRDPLVLRGDRSEIVELVEHVVEAACGEQNVDRRRLVLLVDVDQSQVETPHRQPVLVLEIAESDRLKPEELIQLVEPALVQREVRLERRELRRDVADSLLERVDLACEPTDLRAERRLLRMCVRDLRVQLRELRVDGRFLVAVVVTGQCRRGERQHERKQCHQAFCHARRSSARPRASLHPRSILTCAPAGF